jgi:hypothetical protein
LYFQFLLYHFNILQRLIGFWFQALLGRVLKARDNLMQLCIHGGTIKYHDVIGAKSCGKDEETSDSLEAKPAE